MEGCRMSVAIDSAVTMYDVSYCGQFGCYYVNSFGGWDCFLFEGHCRRHDEMERHTIEKPFKNTTLDFEKRGYMEEIDVMYDLSTGWLTDEQSARFAHELVQSNMVYLHDLVNDRIFPVVIEEDSVEYKTWRDNRKAVAHTITVKESQSRVRR